jgi:hemolysin III
MHATASQPMKPTFRGLSHEVAAFAFPVLGALLIPIARSASVRWAVVVYTVGVTAMYATSACYHRGDWSDRTRLRLRRLDHSMIMIAIAATYTPFAVAVLDRRSATTLLAVVWSLAIFGIIAKVMWLQARWLGLLYIVIGWVALAYAPTLWRGVGVASFALIVLGGLVYSLGALVFATHRPDPVPTVFGFHEIFHALVIAAGLFFYVAIVRVISA